MFKGHPAVSRRGFPAPDRMATSLAGGRLNRFSPRGFRAPDPPAGALQPRCPKMAEPTRTWVAPQAMAVS